MNSSKNNDKVNSHICDFIQSIPTAKDKYKEISDFRSPLTPDSIITLLTFLKFFNSIDLKNGKDALDKWKVKSKSEVAGYFHQSLIEFLKHNRELINTWERFGEKSKIFSFDHGVDFLAKMEEKRSRAIDKNYPIRHVTVAKIVIKAMVRGFKDPMYLLQLDQQINKYQVIGGKGKNLNENLLETAKRELNEELYKNAFIKKGNYKLVPLKIGFKEYEVSPTYGAYTEYTFGVYQLLFEDFDLKLNQSDAWITQEEIEKRLSSDGIPLRVTFEPDILTESLPLSTKRLQPEYMKESIKIEDNNDNGVLKKLLKEGENKKTEFKSSCRWDLKENKLNRYLENIIIKSIAGFLNSEGGTLIIGVDDGGNVIGLDQDIGTLKKRDLDGYMQFLIGLISERLGVEYCSNIEISYEKINSKFICLLVIRKSTSPVFVRDSQMKNFYIRRGNTTKLLDSEETYKYLTTAR